MNIQELRDITSALKIEKQALINDTYLWAKLSREAVEQLPDTKFSFEVPSTGKRGGTRKVTRNDPTRIKSRIVDRDIFCSAFVSMVAAVEDYLAKIMRWILSCDNKRIKCTISGVNLIREISIVELIDKEREVIINEIIEQRIEGLFYASPQKQLEYFDKALDLKLEDEIWGKWIEIKARRDLWIHNAGVVNQIYVEKAKEFSMCKVGETAIIDETYFKESVALLKSMIGKMDRDIRKVYK